MGKTPQSNTIKTISLIVLVTAANGVTSESRAEMSKATSSPMQNNICQFASKAYQQGRMNRDEARGYCASLKQVDYFQDRDNSTSDANDEVGDSMVVVSGPRGQKTQGIQVCPGVILATAHGALDDPLKIKEHNKKHTAKRDKMTYQRPGFGLTIYDYPMSEKTMIRPSKKPKDMKKTYFSPRITDEENWKKVNEATDFVFIKIEGKDTDYLPEKYIQPVLITPEELVVMVKYFCSTSKPL